MIFPDKIERRIVSDRRSGGLRAPDTTYEVLAEMTEMWWQALQAEGELARMSDDKIPNRFHYLADLAKMQGKRQTWEEAIAIYAGWNGVELDRYLGEVLAERKDGTSRA